MSPGPIVLWLVVPCLVDGSLGAAGAPANEGRRDADTGQEHQARLRHVECGDERGRLLAVLLLAGVVAGCRFIGGAAALPVVCQQTTDLPRSSRRCSSRRCSEPPVFEPPVFEPPVFEPPLFEPPVFEPPLFEPPLFEPPLFEPPLFEPPLFEPPLFEPPLFEPPPLVSSPIKASSCA